MTRIAIDLSRREIRLAAETERGTAELTLALSREGSTRIAPAVTRLLELLSTEPAEITEIIVVRGPGSFTGLRVGFAFAAGIARATGATVRSIPLPEAIALAHAADFPPANLRTFGVALAAGRNEAYTAIVRLVDGRPEGGVASVAITPCAALPALFAGVDRIVLDPALPRPEGIAHRFMHLPPRSLFSAARIMEECSGVQPLTPLYVRKSAAREKERGRHMLILAIDTSCDDTSAAVTRDLTVLSCKVRSQMDLHESFGGIVPEEASRAHGEAIDRVVCAALAEAGCTVPDLDLVAATNGPGLLGCLLVGLNFGRGLALAGKIPFYAANHMLGHVFSPFLSGETFDLPAVTLTVSGGHTLIGLLDENLRHRFFGSTIDDAAGEVIDKLGRKLGHSYPAGPTVDHDALGGNPEAVRFPRPLSGTPGFDFSFSGLKTAFLREFEKDPKPGPDMFASLLAAIADCLLARIVALAKERGAKSCLFSGGVASSEFLRRFMAERLPPHGITPRFPERHLCTDNAAMIAACAYFRARGRTFAESSADLAADAYAQFDFAAGHEE